MHERIKNFFENEKIEYYAALDYKDAYEINGRLIENKAIEPRSVIAFLLPYYSGECENISRYSAARDYHIIIKDITSRLCDLLSEIYPDGRFIGFGDHSPIDERGVALSLGLGILGDNGLIINEKYGSYVFIADVITDIEPHIIGAKEKCAIKKCQGCGRCKAACPTGILRGESESCLSAITQKKGELTEAEISLMQKCNTVWGCDICQSVCPHNRDPEITPISFFREDRIEKLTTDALASMDKETFSQRAFAWRGRKTVERNLAYLNY